MNGKWGLEHPDRLAIVKKYLDDTLGGNVWVDEVPGIDEFRNDSPAVLIRGDGGQGLSRHVPVGNHRIAIWCYGGTHNGLPSPHGRHDKTLAMSHFRLLEGVLWTANMVINQYGVLVWANNVIGGQQIREVERGWPLVYSVWEIETKVR